MSEHKYKDKYSRKEVCEFEIYDNLNNLIAVINSVKEDEIKILRKRCFLKLTDALIDKKFYDYLAKNLQFEGSIKAKTIYRDCVNGNDHNVLLEMPKVKLLSYKLKNNFDEISVVNIAFELFKDDNKESVASMILN